MCTKSLIFRFTFLDRCVLFTDMVTNTVLILISEDVLLWLLYLTTAGDCGVSTRCLVDVKIIYLDSIHAIESVHFLKFSLTELR